MTLFNTGNLGIGTGATDGGQRLQVQGTTLLNGNVTFSSATGMTWDATNSRLGIGTNVPAYSLDIRGNINGAVVSVLSNSNSGAAAETTLAIGQSPVGSPFNSIYFSHYGSGFTTNQFRLPSSAVLFAGLGVTNGFSFAVNNDTGHIKFWTGSTATEKMRLFNGGNLLLQNGGTFSDSGERLQVTGTMKVTGASTFGANMTLSFNQNQNTTFTVSNTTSGNISSSQIGLTSDASSGASSYGKYSSTTTAYKILAAKDAYFYNVTGGDIGILNDFASGAIKFAAGGSSTAHMTIKSNGRINMSSLPTSPTGLSSGDLWNNLGMINIV
jgi:hypothetical protein